MYKFAQIQGGQVICLSELHSQIVAENLVELDEQGQFDGHSVQLGDLWDGSSFAPAPEVQP